MPVHGRVRLPAGILKISEEWRIPQDAADLEIEGAPEGTTLRAADGFTGRAMLVVEKARNIRIRNVTFDGNRAMLERPSGLPPHDVPFSRHTKASAILLEGASGITIEHVRFQNVAGFAVLASSCKGVTIAAVTVEDSGSRNEKGRNNATGGILLEEGVEDFAVVSSVFRRVLGNAVWTHSNYRSPRNARGRIAGNRFEQVGRDAIQIGHATEVVVENNTGFLIGWPLEVVDVEGGGTPVAMDTAGNVDHSVYVRNRFEEINGKCIDLDGFHHGSVRRNVCINRKTADGYPFGHFAIVFNNSNPDMQSEEVRVEDNLIDGAKFGGIFLIGSRHVVARNQMQRLNLAGCTENAAQFGCHYLEGEPDLLRSGIYLGRRAERPAPAVDNRIEDNTISGYRMSTRCIAAAPGVSLAANRIARNRCSDTEDGWKGSRTTKP